MTDHMEAAIDAAVRTVFEGMKKTRLEVSPEFEMSVRGQSRRELEAAEPHLRKKWEQPIWEFARKLARPFPDGVPDREGEAIAAELIDVLKGAGE